MFIWLLQTRQLSCDGSGFNSYGVSHIFDKSSGGFMSWNILLCFCILCLRLLVCLRTIGTKNDSGTFILSTYLKPGTIRFGESRLLTAQRLMSIIFRDIFRSKDVYLFAGCLKTVFAVSFGEKVYPASLTSKRGLRFVASTGLFRSWVIISSLSPQSSTCFITSRAFLNDSLLGDSWIPVSGTSFEFWKLTAFSARITFFLI